ncbi:MAG: hypothetical protein Q8O48_08285 [Anaerolineales bacterium]|nr:hypothetical protein [Anaerolineales bacterium]
MNRLCQSSQDVHELVYTANDLPPFAEDMVYHGEPFRVLKDKEVRLYGEYRTSRLMLAEWDGLGQG